ncbi:MAG: signal peptidase II [Desulfobacteraceae bacterium]
MDKLSLARLVIISGSVVIADQVTKAVIQAAFSLYETLPVINGFFNITYIMNPGGAFGIFADQPVLLRKFVFLFLSSMVALLILWLYRRTCSKDRILSSAFALIFGGAVGNLVDRIRFGTVVDFLDFYVGNLHWPAFNIADSAITIGMAIFLYYIAFNKISDV